MPDAVIPAAGRDVQCSNCGDTWFQGPVDTSDDGQAAGRPIGAAAPPAPRVSPRRPRSDSTRDVEASGPAAATAPEAAAEPEPMPESEAETGTESALTGDGTRFESTDPYGAEPTDTARPERDEEPGSEPMSWPAAHDEAVEATTPSPAPLPRTEPAAPPQSWADENGEEDEDDLGPAPMSGARRRELDPSVRDVLREEAEHEAKVRAREGGGLESQPELGLSDPERETDRREREARARMARLRGKPAPAEDSGDDEAHAASRRDLLPDIEEINSSLRSRNQRVEDETEYEEEDPAVRRNFRRAFTLPIFLAAIGVLLYINAPRIATQIPQAAPILRSYVGGVDQGRIWLDANVRELIAWIETRTAS
ncbi:zinc-ribbon domain-containing protein [Ferrimonas balearica]|nr:zinc-ribbon domain-containing protein [Ferrimonas balearica]